MRILHSIRSVNPHGGGPIEGVKQFAAVNQRDGHTVEVVSLDAPTDSWVHEFPFTCHALGPGCGSYGYTAKFVPWLREHAHNYDAVIVDGIWQYSAFGVWRALAGTKNAGGGVTPYFVFPHGMLDPWFKHMYPLKHFKKMLYWPWGDYRVLRDARAVFFTCEEERCLASQTFSRYRANERVVNFGTGAPPPERMGGADARAFQEKFPETRGKRLMLFLGRIHEKKGADLLLRAFAAKLAARDTGNSGEPWHLVMVGPCEHEYGWAMQALARELHIAARVTWSGMLTGVLKWGAFRSAEIFVLPSHQENFGIAVAEALACGVPALISNKVNIWREIVADEAGLAESDDLAGTRTLLTRWADMPASERASMRANARACFARHFDVEHSARHLIREMKT